MIAVASVVPSSIWEVFCNSFPNRGIASICSCSDTRILLPSSLTRLTQLGIDFTDEHVNCFVTEAYM